MPLNWSVFFIFIIIQLFVVFAGERARANAAAPLPISPLHGRFVISGRS